MQLSSILAATLAAVVAAQTPGAPVANVKLYQGGGCTQFVRTVQFAASFSNPPDSCRPLPSDFTTVTVNTTDVTPRCTRKSQHSYSAIVRGWRMAN